MKTITLEEAVRHWSERRTVQVQSFDGNWSNVVPFGRDTSEGGYSADVFNTPGSIFRLHPTKKLIPFTFDTVPKFALWRADSGSAVIAAGWDDRGMLTFTAKEGWHVESWQELLTNWGLSLDHGKTWGPAGLEVEE